MTPKLISQTGRGTCGQTCVAMAVGTTEMEVCEVLNYCHPRGTYTSHIKKALEYYGVKFDERMKPSTKNDPMCKRFKRAILAVTIADMNRVKWHWILWWDGYIYDPGGFWPALPSGSRVTSALVLTGREKGLPW